MFNQYVIQAMLRDDLKKYLEVCGIGSEIYYPKCLHQQDCVVERMGVTDRFPVSERASGIVLALPIYPELTDDQKDSVLSRIAEFYHRP